MASKTATLPPLDYLREIFDYNPLTGMLTWQARPIEHFKSLRYCRIWNTRFAGIEAGSNSQSNYRPVRLDGNDYKAHRIAYFMHYGVEPYYIDHINHDGMDNRIENLRSVSNEENMKNKKLRSNNTSGVNGVSWVKSRNKWAAQIAVDNKGKHLGYFLDFNGAVKARKLAEIKFKFHANHGKDV